jgi:hypothetical protein
MKTLSALSLISLLLLAPLTALQAHDTGMTAKHLLAADSPAAPPVKLATSGEASPEFAAETASKFLSLLDLSQPELARVKELAEQKDLIGALDAYRDLLIAHLKDLTHQEKLDAMRPHENASGSEDLLEGYVLIGRHAGGVSVNYLGHPGAIDWFKIGVDKVQRAPEGVRPEVSAQSDRDFCTHLSSMHHFAPLAEAYHSGNVSRRRQGPVEGTKTGPTAADSKASGDIRYLKAWLGTWEDFARRHKTGYAEVKKARRMDEYNALGASQYQKLFASWRISEFWGQFKRICQRIPEDRYAEVSGVALAAVLSEIVNEHVAVVAKSIDGVPNQAAVAVSTVMQTVVCMPGLKMGPGWEKSARAQVVQYYKTINLPDGTNLEQAINYNKGNPELLVRMIKLHPDRPAWILDLIPYAEQTLLYLASMLRNGSHPGALPRWGQDDRSEEEVLRGYLEYLPNADVEKILARVYGPEDKGDPSFSSAQFPYSGYYAMRDGWRKDDAFCIFKASPRAYGHHRNDNTSIHLGAFGRDLLVDSGSGTYDNKPINAYLNNSFSKNSITVDGKSQARVKIGGGNRGAIATAEAPQPNRWHTSATFDFAEGVYDAGYEDPAINVRHERQVISLRGQGLWIVSDRMRGEVTPMPIDETHTYTQTWNFDDSYPKGQVQINEQERRVWSDDPKGANVAIYNFAGAPLSYRKWYGEVLNDGSHRGWVRGKAPAAKTPAVDVHATWTGLGEQLVVTLIEARKKNQGQIRHIESIQSACVQGFRATLADQTVVTYLAALDEAHLSEHGVTMLGSALLTVTDGENQTRGIALDAGNWKAGEQNGPTGNFEFALTKGIPTDIREIRYPDGALPRRHSPTKNEGAK